MTNLHVLLRSSYFATLPLEVHFFDEKVHREWRRCAQRADGPLPPGIHFVKDFEDPGATAASLVTSYDSFREYIEKSTALLEATEIRCAVCKTDVDRTDAIIICSHSGCHAASHLSCLASNFLGGTSSLIPIEGSCPECKQRVEWPVLMKELSLRLRGTGEVKKLLHQRRRVGKSKSLSAESSVPDEARSIDGGQEIRHLMNDLLPDDSGISHLAADNQIPYPISSPTDSDDGNLPTQRHHPESSQETNSSDTKNQTIDEIIRDILDEQKFDGFSSETEPDSTCNSANPQEIVIIDD